MFDKINKLLTNLIAITNGVLIGNILVFPNSNDWKSYLIILTSLISFKLFIKEK